MTPTEAYQSDIKNRGFQTDEAQAEAVRYTQTLYDALLTTKPVKTSATLLNFLKKNRITPVKGLYFWGGVGRGKSYLIDTFHNCLPFPDKKRVHFNQFMQDIHNQLKNLPKTPDPLVIVSAKIA
ncbi:MAG: AFG1/ZapE family ATPase, partial [Gammaproteobacteria bacterium]|nr:AFG1/ZapE family ATPase [Gammaproteobacteria bacterium]